MSCAKYLKNMITNECINIKKNSDVTDKKLVDNTANK